ncbi:tetratricopeptide (TPR) repeat protein [Kitasatospora sp. GAS204A]|uniref:hypothetical protein n=1 Tax=unclassified Kitasatospora TaxID=2633591 RepID=UPI002474BD7E|nr:hypothetical protein [Kitasatospora sp. GAS204B]MDH6121671.1 tetratricopeptide (TPR) repeat protein [Kitasatospora sp. GAS204B]
MTATRVPNQHLRALLAEAGWSGEELARAVNRAGAADGYRFRYDRTAVAHWLSGSRPAAPVPALVAEVLSRTLGRTVEVADTRLARPSGRTAAAAGTPEQGTAEPIGALLARLAEAAADPPGVAGPVYSLARRLVPAYPAPAGVRLLPPAAPASSAATRVGGAHLRLARDLTALLLVADEALGADRCRPVLTGLLATVLSDWLRAPAAPAVRRELLLVTSRLSYLAGFGCFDGQRQGAAQAYYRLAGQLAAEAADPRLHAIALRGLSVQAHYLGRRRRARELADAAGAHLALLTHRQKAFVLGQQALGAAGCGDRATAFAQLARAQRSLERAEPASLDLAGYHWAAYAHQEAEVLAALGDTAGAVRSLIRSLRERPPGERRARATTNARLAQLLLDRGLLDRACATWHAVLDDYPLLASARLRTAVTTMHARLRPHAGSPAVRALLTRAALVVGVAGQLASGG